MNKKENKMEPKMKKSSNGVSQYVLLSILILLFGFTLYSSLVILGKYYKEKEIDNKNQEIIVSGKNKIIITNNGIIDKILESKDFTNGEEVVIENIDTIEIISKDYDNVIKKYFDVRYNISENTFPANSVATSDSPLLVRFAYSFDKEEWTYLTNVISLNGTNITPLTGALYDLSGITGNIRVATNYDIVPDPYRPIKMYWKSETIIKYSDENLGKKIKAEFKVNYKSSD